MTDLTHMTDDELAGHIRGGSPFRDGTDSHDDWQEDADNALDELLRRAKERADFMRNMEGAPNLQAENEILRARVDESNQHAIDFMRERDALRAQVERAQRFLLERAAFIRATTPAIPPTETASEAADGEAADE